MKKAIDIGDSAGAAAQPRPTAGVVRRCGRKTRAVLARRLVASALVAALFAGGGCGGSSGERSHSAVGSFVGPVRGSGAFVAVVSNGRAVEAYVCDGRTGKKFTGSMDGARAELVSDDGARLLITVRGGRAKGSLAEGGNELTFNAGPARGKAGYYTAETRDGRRLASWVVLADGRQRGVRQAGTATGGSRPQPSSSVRETGNQTPAPPPDKFDAGLTERLDAHEPRPVRPQDLGESDAEEGIG